MGRTLRPAIDGGVSADLPIFGGASAPARGGGRLVQALTR